MKNTTIDVVVGAQYGSEGKGHVTAQLVRQAAEAVQNNDLDLLVNVRVAGPNAGHTVYDSDGNRFALRSVPVGAAVSGYVTCYLAAGSEVELEVLFDELDLLATYGHKPELWVDEEATLLQDVHKRQEGEARLTERVGSTGKGIGAARADRLMRKALRVKDSPQALAKLAQYGVHVGNPLEHYSLLENQAIIIEGTQGYGLGLHAGHYPQCTSSDCRAVDFLAMAGISPWTVDVTRFQVWLAARVYPIRVAGNSGPMEGETTWDELGLPEEHTTVTQKVRRVGQWDTQLVADAVKANGGPHNPRVVLAVTMLDQKFPAVQFAAQDHVGLSGLLDLVYTKDPLASLYLSEITAATGAEVAMVTTSPSTAITY